MPKNKMSEAFMTVKSWLRSAAEEFGIPMSSREAHRVTNAYVSILRDDEYMAIVHKDPTGEEAVRRWLTAQMKAVAA